MDDDDVVDGLRDLGEHVARDEDGAPLGRHAAQEVAQPADALRVEAVGGLVEDQHARVAEQRRGEPEALAHAERVLARPAVGGVVELDEPQHLVDARRGSPAIAASARRWLRPERPGMGARASRFAPTVRAGSSSST